jgi:O-antigen ligase
LKTQQIQTYLQHTGLIALVLFAYSGALKWLPWPFDATALFSAILILVVGIYFINLRRRPDKNSLIIIYLLLSFLFWYSLTSVYTLSQSFYLQKLQGLILDALALVCAFILIRTNNSARIYYAILFVIASIASVAILYLQSLGQLDYLIMLGLNQELNGFPDYLILGKFIGIGAIVILGYGYFWCITVGLIMVTTIFLLGARGPAIFVLISCIILFLVNKSKLRLNGRILVILFITFGLGFATYLEVAQILANFESDRLIRFSAIFTDPQSIRGEVFQDAFSMIASYPLLGVGIGGYGQAGYGVDENVYPHNLFLEVIAESGILGFLIFMLGVTMFFLRGFKWVNSTERAIAIAVLVFLFLNYMKTGSFIGARDLYMHFGVVIALSRFPRIKSGVSRVSL